jgi:transposase-like protein
MPAALPQDERNKIAAALKSGGKRNEVAREFGRSPALVSKIASEEGIEFDRSQTKKAADATREYALAERLRVSNELFEKLRAMTGEVATPGQLRELATAYGILTDKRRLEDGEVTARSESHNHSHSTDLDGYFAELDEYRAQYGEADSKQPMDTNQTN